MCLSHKASWEQDLIGSFSPNSILGFPKRKWKLGGFEGDIDGRQAVSFLMRIKEYIEDPDKLLLEL